MFEKSFNLLYNTCNKLGGFIMTEQHIKEDLSLAYVQAICAKAGMSLNIRSRDYGIDGTIYDIYYSKHLNTYRESGFALDFQLKSTVTAIINDDEVIYDLEVKNYRDLIETNMGHSRILILYVLPRNEEEWITFSKEETILKGCAYWCSLKGKEDVANTKKIRIRISNKQRLTVDELKHLMELEKEGIEL